MTSDVLIGVEGGLGRITLNRPQALNALTHEMCAIMYETLQRWAVDSAVHTVLIDAVPARAFCAGGDIRAIARMGREDMPAAEAFFATEYGLNAAIKHFPKPYVAWINGLTMGGGAGVTIHGRYRVVGESAAFAMPETGIGLYPDIGGTYFLSRLPGETGVYLGLTGARITAADMVWLGLATHYTSSATSETLRQSLAGGTPPHIALERLAEPPPMASPLAAHVDEINRAFSAASVEAILDVLKNGRDWAKGQAQVLASRSPTSLKLTLRALREARSLDFDDCMRMEYRLTLRVLGGHDLYEGVRAVLIDKDQLPLWSPASLAEVTDAAIQRYFEPLGEKELGICNRAKQSLTDQS